MNDEKLNDILASLIDLTGSVNDMLKREIKNTKVLINLQQRIEEIEEQNK